MICTAMFRNGAWIVDLMEEEVLNGIQVSKRRKLIPRGRQWGRHVSDVAGDGFTKRMVADPYSATVVMLVIDLTSLAFDSLAPQILRDNRSFKVMVGLP